MTSSACDGEPDQSYLCVQGLSKVYASHDGPVRALDQVSVRAQRGEFLSVLGPSGQSRAV
jgi:ABC-type glutathione transport system ATPase component